MSSKAKKILSLLLAISLIFSCFTGISFTVSAETEIASITAAAKTYVETNKNNSTVAGLLAAVQAVDSSVTLDSANDYFIKHSVPGAVDVMADSSENLYPLDIKGSDGAVAAVFKVNGNSINFVAAFAHEVETINISKVAVAGVTDGFTYDTSGNITGYPSGADKIVIPAEFTGTIAASTTYVAPGKNSGIKVLIINNTVKMKYCACEGWVGLRAVQFAENTPETAWAIYDTASLNSSNYGRFFCHCHNLKYVKLPTYLKQPWSGAAILPALTFCQAWELENINLNQATSDFSLAYRTFDGVIVKDFFLPEHYSYTQNVANYNYVFNKETATYGYPQITKYTDDMTTARAVALAAAKVNELQRANEAVTEEAVESIIVNAQNAETIKENMTVTAEGAVDNDYYSGNVVDLTVNGELFTIGEKTCKTLSSLSTSPYDLTASFNPSVTEYNVDVPNSITELSVNAVAVSGATVGTITGNTNLIEGTNTVTVPVTNTDGNTVNYTINVNRKSSINPLIISAAKTYVEETKNAVTYDGLLEAVQAVDSTVTLAEADFYIKHAVPGVKDNTTDYPLNIEGSDGAVAAIFGWNGVRYGFTYAFAHEVETVEITETAVVGTSEGFTYDDSGNVTAYSGTADKIVFPAGYSGTMFELADTSAVNAVKVVIVNNTANTALAYKGFYNWNGLIAVQIADQTDKAFFGQYNTDDTKTSREVFAECDSLKYVKLPKAGIYAGWTTLYLPARAFRNSNKLENVNFPTVNNTQNHPIGYNTFTGTALRELVFPNYVTYNSANNPYTTPTYSGGTRNIHYYSDDMTFVRAMAYAAAAVNELETTATTTEEDILAAANSAITGSSNAEALKASLTYVTAKAYTYNDYSTSYEAMVSDGNDEIPISINKSKILTNLTTNYGITPAFNSATTNYSVTVPGAVTEVEVIATPAEGAVVGEITGNTGITGETAEITVPVTVGNETFNYTIIVSKRAKLNADAVNAAEAYVSEKQNEVTLDGLLSAVKTVYPQAKLDKSDFYIKHAVNGVKDNDTVSGYPLNIEGSNGSVTAIFDIDGVKYAFNTVFGFKTEMLEIGSYAIVGNEAYAEYFTYDESGNVTAINKPIEKLIFPEGYTGTMTALSDDSLINADKVKVLIYNCSTAFLTRAFADWQGLIAVQMDNGDTSFQLASAVNNQREQYMFADCPSLKYFKFPQKVNNSYYWNAMFPNFFFNNSYRLETVIMPETATSGAPYAIYGSGVFQGTNVREIQWPAYGTNVVADTGDYMYDSPAFTEGTRNIHYPTDAMTATRAISLIAAELSNADGRTSESIIAAARAAVKGTNDADVFAEALDLAWIENSADNYSVNGELAIIGEDVDSYISADISKTLSLLTVGGEAVDFDSEVLSYTVVEDYLTASLDISAIPVDGANVSIDNNISDNKATITVTNTDGKQVIYTVVVERMGSVINANVMTAICKGLLGISGGIELNMNKDAAFDIRDLVRAKKFAVNGTDIDAGNVPLVGASRNALTTEDIISTFGYVNENGEITDTMFGGIGFRPTTDWMYDYSGGTTTRRNTTKREWSNLIHNVMLQDGYNMDAINEAAGQVKLALNNPNLKIAVYMPIAITNADFADWGTLNGAALNFANTNDRIAALNWMIDESKAAFEAKNYENIELYGFYFIDEALREGDENIFPSVTARANELGYKTMWAPYSDARGTNNRGDVAVENEWPIWSNYNEKLFDYVTYQINYFPGREDLPSARPISYIKEISAEAKKHGASIEMELCGTTKENISGLKEYFKGGIDYGYMNNNVLSWWISADCATVHYLSKSDDAYIRSTYDEMYKFINKTLTKNEINMTQDYDLYVNFGTDSGVNNAPKVQVVTPYNASNDMVMVMQSQGGNNIFNVSSPLKVAANLDLTDTTAMNTALANASQLIDSTGTSDWFGPHKVYAVNNADGDKTSYGGFQGGAHSYENTEDTSKSATGRSDNVRVVVDGMTKTASYYGPADSVSILWDVYVQAMNTVKEDGTGREVLVEHHSMTWDTDKWVYEVDIEFLEAVTWNTYYGTQAVLGNSWNGEISFDNEATWASVNGANISNNSGNKYTDLMIARKNGNYIEMYLDNSYGIGDRRYLSDTASGAFSRSYSGFGKCYFNLVNQNSSMAKGSHALYRGYYKFYSK